MKQQITYTTIGLRVLTAVLFFMAVTASHVYSQDYERQALVARKAYDTGKYDQSIQIYEKILHNGFESAVLYYNLGNAYFRNKEIPSAILYYEKALKLDPNNEDIRHNIAISNSKITDKVENVPDLFYKRWWKSATDLVSLDSMAVLVLILFSISLVLIGVYLASKHLQIRKLSFYTAIFFLAVALLAFYAAEQKKHILLNDHEAIVFTPTVTVKSSPDAASTDLFVIHEGLKVMLLDKIGEWQEIRIANGSIGWLKSSDIRNI